MKAIDLERLLIEKASKEKSKVLQRFFKTSVGEYGEGDVFMGVTVPVIRNIAKQAEEMTLSNVEILLNSEKHECRTAAVVILTHKFEKARKDEAKQREIFEFYISHHERINNWDLVDISAPRVVGGYLLERDKSVLKKYAQSKNMWLQRIAMVSTWWMIRKGHYTTTLELAEMLLNHPHDLMHKAVGWMLREVGKKNMALEEEFLLGDNRRYNRMPRTMLRYAIEKFPEKERTAYLKGEI